MRKDDRLYYNVEIENGVLTVELMRDTFWDSFFEEDSKRHFYEIYKESYLSEKSIMIHYYKSFGNTKNTKRCIEEFLKIYRI